MTTLFVGRAFADHRFAADQCWPLDIHLGLAYGRINGRRIMSINTANHLPAVSLKALGDIFGKPALDMAVDGNAIVVPKHDQLG